MQKSLEIQPIIQTGPLRNIEKGSLSPHVVIGDERLPLSLVEYQMGRRRPRMGRACPVTQLTWVEKPEDSVSPNVVILGFEAGSV